eukprot:1578211-Heterocapsa_arctica.AAC.1
MDNAELQQSKKMFKLSNISKRNEKEEQLYIAKQIRQEEEKDSNKDGNTDFDMQYIKSVANRVQSIEGT